MFSIVIYAIGFLLSVAASALFMILGIDWITIGYGLHPYLAFTCTLLSAAAAAWFLREAHEEYLDFAFLSS